MNFVLTRQAVGLCKTDPNLWVNQIRQASKMSRTSTRNAKQAPGKRWGIKKWDGQRVYSDDIIVSQGRLNFLPGLNVVIVGSFYLKARKEGTVRFSCERTNLDYTHTWVQKFMPNSQGTPYFKKYVNVIPDPDHHRFKLVKQV